MEEKKSGFFCVVYFILQTEFRKDKNGNEKKIITEGKTAFYHKVYAPHKLADYLKNNNWKWIKGFRSKDDYLANKDNYLFIFDETNPPSIFTFRSFSTN